MGKAMNAKTNEPRTAIVTGASSGIGLGATRAPPRLKGSPFRILPFKTWVKAAPWLRSSD
jgi:hypothetical protein